MKIIQLKNRANGYATIDFSQIDMNIVLKEGKLELINGKSFKWDKVTGEAIGDCPFYMGAMPIFSTEKLGQTFADTDVKTATFDVEGTSYTIVDVPHLEENVINFDESKYRKFRSGKIMNISTYVFKSNVTYPPIFTPEEFVMFTFCKPEIAWKLLECRFSQLEFVECDVK